ncbi:DUF6772 family protein [Rhizobium ruizarguesonis]|uniref:DUF6772 family protein n=1 Tax=Rhizobium ruizarguesonis TaxID=2081791 RepID=UPI00103002BE|nr:DUF6772 family protein [Rhizobium ruizarguesonis]TAU27933.1 hypothetical protein ELI48_18200 [Rhizobium ruizarguesonis]TAU71480.1 hypothetical protein ELI45_18945 [Rhizobium ruizarguesonis]TAV17186.1 hypothetical protein ELI34_18120 [Rhizobium ruizarguesonis]TAV29693.1 hypothetical protein ELI35_19710 [Rhizobium ruizarguesonis]TAW11350.1 hypothetical protein ELI26_18260 [Rhizobium ruizarguesonis]
MRLAMLRADPALSRFDPLPRILSFDDFSRGHCGWSQLVGNYEDTLDVMLPGFAQHSNAMLSTLGHWDAGSHGGMDSSYALKIATKAKPGAQNVAIKRHTFRKRGPIRFEIFFTFKPEATELKLSETDVRSIGFLFDLQCGDRDGDGERVMPHLRFLNALDGKHLQKWQYKRETTSFTAIGREDKTVSHYHLAPEGWLDLPDGEQRLCYNEIPTKVNWSYMRFDFDLASMKATGLQCNDRNFDVSGFESIRIPAMKNLWCMLNFCLFAETDVAKRAFLYVDSICISGDF